MNPVSDFIGFFGKPEAKKKIYERKNSEKSVITSVPRWRETLRDEKPSVTRKTMGTLALSNSDSMYTSKVPIVYISRMLRPLLNTPDPGYLENYVRIVAFA